ncbi:hypothetical protein C7M84_017012 [Penaeus vannamei]|uniref:C2 domain-containing protein n=1 Tax=Penaeus vannamei TaxID=6689 RepID=A0A423SLL8_PENVA|nr:hypothetical protein C7M84_017012 [Penaeus vannamei]
MVSLGAPSPPLNRKRSFGLLLSFLSFSGFRPEERILGSGIGVEDPQDQLFFSLLFFFSICGPPSFSAIFLQRAYCLSAPPPPLLPTLQPYPLPPYPTLVASPPPLFPLVPSLPYPRPILTPPLISHFIPTSLPPPIPYLPSPISHTHPSPSDPHASPSPPPYPSPSPPIPDGTPPPCHPLSPPPLHSSTSRPPSILAPLPTPYANPTPPPLTPYANPSPPPPIPVPPPPFHHLSLPNANPSPPPPIPVPPPPPPSIPPPLPRQAIWTHSCCSLTSCLECPWEGTEIFGFVCVAPSQTPTNTKYTYMSPVHGTHPETSSLLGALSSKRDSTYSSMSEYSGRTSPTNSCRSSVGDSVGSGVGSPVGGEAQGHLSFGIQYIPTGSRGATLETRLVITVIEARGLAGKEYLGNACDPYVKVVLWKERRSLRKHKSPPLHVFRTRTVRHTQDPSFNQSFVVEASKSELKVKWKCE